MFCRFLTFVLSVYTKSKDFILAQSASEELILLAKDLYAEYPKDEHITGLYLMVSFASVKIIL